MESDAGDRFESLPERLIREAMEAGEFDDVPGQGRPLSGAGTPDDDTWWVRGWLKRNGFDTGSRKANASDSSQ
jgi:hypothetical protein